MIQKTKVKKLFNDEDIQCPVSTLNLIEEHLKREVRNMVFRTKEGNVRRLTPELLWVALGNLNQNKPR
tara:strand:+ start:11667 stop:11870 length:204 start_codon:yes stop_codon:yes gene_type:complete